MEATSKTVKLLDTNCCAHHWNCDDGDGDGPPKKALVVLYHGFLAHGKYPTVRYAAEFLAQAGYAVVAVDFPGHGKSEGDRGYLSSASMVLDYGVAMAEYAKGLLLLSSPTDDNNTAAATTKLFLVGSSMGGAIALSVAQKTPNAGVVLLAPMLKLNVSSVEHVLLTGLSYIVGSVNLIPSSATDDSKQYRDATKRKECHEDPLTVSGSLLKVASALTCVDITLNLKELFGSVDTSMLIMVADEDVVVKNEGSEELFERSPSKDKTKKHYPALHGLLCEPVPLFDEIKKDVLDWMGERAA
jgi:caffeoylshikimate esterase